MIINSRKKNAMNYYSSGVKALTGSGENKIKLEPRLEKVYIFYSLYLFSKLYNFYFQILNDLNNLTEVEEEDNDETTEDTQNSVIKFESLSYAVTEDEQTCRVKIIRTGSTNQEVSIRL